MVATRLRVAFLVVAAAMGVAGVVAPRVASADAEQLRSALEDYAAGRDADALKKLQEYVASNPGDDVANRSGMCPST